MGLITTAAGSDGTGFATPMDQAWDTAEALISDGVVHHVWLGIEGDDLDATTAPFGVRAPAVWSWNG